MEISDEASWHNNYKDSPYVFVGGISHDLTEGDLLAVFAQYGEVVDVNLVRDKVTGKLKGFAFVAYEDQRSTTLAVDNLNDAKVLGRIIKVDHCGEYVKREDEDEETMHKKREACGVCRAFQRRECTRGDSCKFSHDERVKDHNHLRYAIFGRSMLFDVFFSLIFRLIYGQRAANTGWGHEDDRRSFR